MKKLSYLMITIAAGSSVCLLLGREGRAASQSQQNASLIAAFSTNSPAAQDLLQEQIISKEREGLDALKTGDLALFTDLTADDAVFVDDHGAAGKTQVVQNTSQFRLTDYRMDNVKFAAISANSALISYEMTEKGTSHGKEFSAHVFVSSVWIERAGKWLCLFSQETAAR